MCQENYKDTNMFDRAAIADLYDQAYLMMMSLYYNHATL